MHAYLIMKQVVKMQRAVDLNVSLIFDSFTWKQVQTFERNSNNNDDDCEKKIPKIHIACT